MSRRWGIFCVFALLYVLAYFYRVSLAVMADRLAGELLLDAGQLGTLSGVFFYAFALAQLPYGPLLDRFGGRRVVLVTGLVTMAGVVVFASARSYPAALAGRILLGCGSASVLMGALRLFTHWFERQEFGRVSGFIIAVGNLGNLAGTAPLAWLVETVGWRGTFLGVGVAQGLTLGALQLGVRERPAGAAPPPEDTGHSPLAGLRRVIGSRFYWSVSFAAFSWYAAYMAVQGLWGGPYLMEVLGLSRGAAGRLLLATSLGFLVGCLLIGLLGERWGGSRQRTLLAGQLLQLACLACLLGPLESFPSWLRFPFFLLFGLAVAAGVTVYPLLREAYPVTITGTALTAVNFFILLGAAMVQQAMGVVIGAFARGPAGYPPAAYHAAFLLPVVTLALASLCFAFGARRPPP